MLRIIVLGVAAGGGVPQWNCNCQVCRTARARPELRATQASVAVSGDGANWFLINASPDIRSQIIATPALHPAGPAVRGSPIAGVILTNGEVDAVTGLLSLREGSPFTIYAHQQVLATLDENSIFNVLDRSLVPRREIAPGEPFQPQLPDGAPSGLEIEAFIAPGKPAWYLEGTDRAAAEAEGDTLGLQVRATDGSGEMVFLAACAEVTPQVADRLRDAPLVFFDGTLWRDDEMHATGLGSKTGRRMGHVSMSGEGGAIAALAGLGIGRKVFLHINNSNPALIPGSPERAELERAGWEIPLEGTEITP